MQEQIERIRQQVEACLEEYKLQCGTAFGWRAANPETRAHVISTGTSILCTKWKVGHSGGGFVKAVVDNDLYAAFSRADAINQDCIKFYLMLIHNTSYIP